MSNVPSPEEELIQMRRAERRYENNAAFTEAVKQGNLSLACNFALQMAAEEPPLERGTNPLQHAQYLCIVLNAQLHHALEHSGVHPYRLDQFSKEIAMDIEQLRKEEEAQRYGQQIIRQYCMLVQEYAYPDLKPFTRLAVIYIKNHLSDNLTVKDTAKALTVNANYLSHQFHKDMGMTFIEFLNRERVRQAASLLRSTNLQIQQIAAAVGYNNTSYFSKQFLKSYGMTPRAYRTGAGEEPNAQNRKCTF